jgi:hypothetical protein
MTMCFSAAWFVNLLIWLIVICAVVAVFRLVLPIVLGWLGVAGGVVMQVLNIILIAFVLIVLVWFCYDLLTCAGGAGMRVR